MNEMRNPTEFVTLWGTHSRRVYAYILTLVYNVADAEDILQETIATLWEKFDEFEPGTDFGAWAVRIAYFKVCNWLHKRKPMEPLDEALLGLLTNETAAAADLLDTQFIALSKCIGKLSSTQRELIEVRYSGNNSVQQAATRVGRSVHYVYRALRRVHEQLFKCIQRQLAAEKVS
jgi:RNA polymerase sigma-70 factor (ECF subfamily)